MKSKMNLGMKTLAIFCVLALLMSMGLTGCKLGEDEELAEGSTTVVSYEEDAPWENEEGEAAEEDDGGSQSTSDPLKKKSSSDKSATSGTTGGQTSGTTQTTKSNFDPYKSMPDSVKNQTVNIFLWWKPTSNEQKVMKDFKAKYGINFKVSQVDKPLYQTRLTALISSGQAPDICAMDYESFPTPIFKNQVQPIDVGAYDIKNDPAYDLQQMNLFKWKGKYYGVQLKGNMTYQRGCVYFNETLFKERGVTNPYELWKQGKWNWDTFANAAKKMTFTKNGKTCYGITSDQTWINYLLSSAGVDFVTNTGTTIKNNLSNKKVLSTMSFVSDLKTGGYWNPQEGGTAALKNRTTAMLLEGSWLMEATSAANSLDSDTNTWGVAPIPSPKGQETIQGIGPCVWCIASGAQHPVAASYFLRYWLDADNFNMKKQIPNEKAREVFNAMSNAANRYGMISYGITTYVDSNNYWQLLDLGSLPKNDIPVEIQSKSPMLDGIIKQILRDAK